MTDPAFLPLRPRAVTRPWGGRALAQRFGWDDPGPVGEWWLASCHPAALTELSDPERAAGHADLPAWLDGPGAGRSLPASSAFPLLVKFLDAREVLSAQVHPDDEVARRHGLPNGKTEAWVILDADPGATLWLGLADGVSAADLHARLAAGASDDDARALMRAVQPSAGDVLLVPAGTVHAIGPGIRLYEVQQTSDATYRLHDWGRGRELHLDEAAQALRDEPPPVCARLADAIDGEALVDDPAFRLRVLRPDGEHPIDVPRDYGVLTVLQGGGRLRDARGERAYVAGDSALVLGACSFRGDGSVLLLAEPGR